MKFATRAVHVGLGPDALTGGLPAPIHTAATYVQRGPGDPGPYKYSRAGSPSKEALEVGLADLEGARHGVAFSSGLAAEDAILRLLRPGDTVLAGNDLYGGTFRLLSEIYGRVHVEVMFCDLNDMDEVRRCWTDSIRMVWLETPSNPTLKIYLIEQISSQAHKHNALVVVDNTIATPVLQRPLMHGADLVAHSTTKYVGGHSDVLGGFVCTNDDAIAESIRFHQRATGAVPSSFDCYLLSRGVRTLPLRVEHQCASALKVAEFLQNHPKVESVNYPGLSTDIGHTAALAQMHGGFGGVVSFYPRGGHDSAIRIANRTRLFHLAVSLGSVESLVEVPALMSHKAATGSELAVNPDLVRLSIGLEDVDDLISDLESTLDDE